LFDSVSVCLFIGVGLFSNILMKTKNVQTAQWYLNHFDAGLIMCEPNQDGVIEWMGNDKNWTVIGWLEDGVYADKTRSEKLAFISEFLNS